MKEPWIGKYIDMEKRFIGVLAGVGIVLRALSGELPVVQDVDVVVAGGSSAAVAAAVAVKEAGAPVFLAAPRPYLGEDLAGTLRLARVLGDDESHPLYRAIFDGRRSEREGWSYTYTYDSAPDGHGRCTLEAYAADPRRAFAAHARLVLSGGNPR